ncbi:MAG: L-glutamate gamma-semialdehyde dehydrogenase [Oligoflexia bacterium]|nr:L-glutamate gamma-semialdehyde dehydrogenase [Oligoflexia bacterium]MBF0364577.1 L-glutamate gamma-semialdehyde dehydrogenase [Oligoflexia bacterium]
MSMAIFTAPVPQNEAIKMYAPGSPEKQLLKQELERQKRESVDVPLFIGGEEIRTNRVEEIRCPHDHSLKLGRYHKAGPEEIAMAIKSSLCAREAWSEVSFEDRAAIFLKAADLLATKYRYIVNAATMLGQSKSPFQAEIDSACELIDFFRFNVYYMQEIYKEQPMVSPTGNWNRLEYRPLEGLIFAVSPFNFTSIGGNLPTAPAMLGNVALWKPASTSMLSSYYIMKLLQEAGLPGGVINMIPGKGSEIGNTVLNHPALAGIHFTGSTSVFQTMWKTVGENLSKNIYKNYPRIVGETGGKDFIFAHKDCDIRALAVAMVRGAFEYQGQKCSAASRAYVPKSIWPSVREEMVKMVETITVGDICDFKTFMGAVIDKNSFDNIVSYIEYARRASDAKVVIGGKYDDSKGYFIHPTVVETSNPKFKLMEEEIFGPVLTVYYYDDAELEKSLKLVDETSPYALTGAIFARDREVIAHLSKALRNCAGNFYINDKPTGAVVGQQPFGGARGSGTNDKAGSHLNLLRWVSPRSIKENFVPVHQIDYPHMLES